jgi:S-adenosylmethionine:tRNA ribosyltransferase-isomerase
MKLSQFDFQLPKSSIARFPAKERTESRLMVVDRQSGSISHHRFQQLPDLLAADDFLVINNSRVIPAKFFALIGNQRVEMQMVRQIDEYEMEVLCLPAKKFKLQTAIDFSHEISAQVIAAGNRGRRQIRFNQPLSKVFELGFAPLPPYIKRKYAEAEENKQTDLTRYQTVYAKKSGSIAAPTAGLHFDQALLEIIKKKHPLVELTLDVGEATFQKIEVDDITRHGMGIETITIDRSSREKIYQLKKTKKLIAVGTTSVRSLESLAVLNPLTETFPSDLFIYPGYQFKLVDGMITNFHLPQSSLFILVCALAGTELMQKAYHLAITEGYRFFSYGDAMLIR